ncbi:hypothetical protein A35E_00072 [secondary endosymbiont of Heteropsylla cubana]|uniref:GHMP kinase C-terminal domain-containing protein n=1 Tax=secondary endosymbiont of Heteropsylla cubana TaxID=134287 RepID=J3Z530_9ENTR|nr:hypothetical protein A35E_00072 [secondary endosymbiont of Heteropsylla cubana]
MALNVQWCCGLDVATLENLGLSLGADVPLFIRGVAAFGEGVGDQLTLASFVEKWYFVAVPPIGIETRSIFNDPELKRDSPRRSFSELMSLPFYNDCEPIVRKRFSIVEKHILWLLKYAPCRLTGTGSCVFSEFDDEASAYQLLSKIPDWMHGFVARGVQVSPLYRALW